MLLPLPDTPVTQPSRPNGKVHVDALEVVLPGAAHRDDVAVARPALLGRGDALASAEVRAGERRLVGHHLGNVAGGDDVSAVLAGAGAEVNDVVGGAHHGVVVLDDDDGVAHVAEAGEGPDEAVVVVGVQADGGLVAHVEHAGESAADLGGEADALGLAARESAGRAAHGDVVEADAVEELEAALDLLEDLVGDDHFALGEGGGLVDGGSGAASVPAGASGFGFGPVGVRCALGCQRLIRMMPVGAVMPVAAVMPLLP